MKKIVALLLTAAVLMSFYGCRGGREDMTGDDSSVESGARSEEKAALDEVRKSDLACPDKTVALTEEAARLWLLAGGKLYAVCDSENEISGLSGNEKKLGKSGVVNAEEVLKLSPDHVLLDDSLPNAKELKEALSNAGIRCEDTTITSFDDYFSTVKNFCMMTKNADAYDGKESGTERSDNVTFELIRVSADGAAIASNNDWVCSMLEDLGLVNLCAEEEPVAVTWKNAEKSRTTASHAAESGTAESSNTESGLSGEESAPSEAQNTGTESGANGEQVSSANDREAFAKEIGKNPDFIFVIYCESEKQYRKEFEELTDSIRGWNSLKAVKSNHMITLPKESFCTLPNDAWDLPMEYLYQSIFLMG